MASFWKPEACGQTELPDRSVLIGLKLVENAKIQKFKCDILGDFQTLWCDKKDCDYCDFFTTLSSPPFQQNVTKSKTQLSTKRLFW